MCQGWHEIHRNDPGHRWLRTALINAAKKETQRRPGQTRRDSESTEIERAK
jgi:hypothetical protein